MDSIISRLSSLIAIVAGMAFAVSVFHAAGMLVAFPAGGTQMFLDVSDILNFSPLLMSLCIVACLIVAVAYWLFFGSDGPLTHFDGLEGTKSNWLRTGIFCLIMLAPWFGALYFGWASWELFLGVVIFAAASTILFARFVPLIKTSANLAASYGSLAFVVALAASSVLGYKDGKHWSTCPVEVELSDKSKMFGKGFLPLDRGLIVLDAGSTKIIFANWGSIKNVVREPC